MTRYVAFLRGINVGGHHKVPMAELRKVLEGIGFCGVKTLLASGNVLFEAEKQSSKGLSNIMEDALEKKFGFQIGTIVRAGSDLAKMVQSQPFKNVNVGTQIRLYVTFLSKKTKSDLKIPYTSPDKSFRILSVTPTAVFSVLDVTKTHTTDAMKIVEKEFGKNVTTRNWNTILKMVG